jgi:hypothetical protein
VDPDLIAALAEDRRMSCPCGVITDQPHQPCRKCLARVIWQCHTGRPPQGAVRRYADRRARVWASVYPVATSIRTISKRARS